MPLLPTTLLTLGSILLIHACYSAYEHSTLLSPSPSTTSSDPTLLTPSAATTSLPPDITLETLLSVLLLCAGIVISASSEGLKPIQWRVWAAGVDHGSPKGTNANGGKGGNTLGADLGEGAIYKLLEQGKRKGFLDLRTQRKEFAEWVKKGE